jgi:hypothetical protein
MPLPKFQKGQDPFGPGGPYEGQRYVPPAGPTRNKLAAMKAEELGIDPFEVLLLIAGNRYDDLYPQAPGLNPAQPKHRFVGIEDRVKAAAEAAKYIYPTLKSVEHTGTDGSPLEVLMKLGSDGLEKRIAELEASLGAQPFTIDQEPEATPVEPPRLSSDEIPPEET